MNFHKSPLRKGDMVLILAGEGRGQTGKLLKIDRKNDKVVVEGFKSRSSQNKHKKHLGPRESFIHISNVMYAHKDEEGNMIGTRLRKNKENSTRIMIKNNMEVA